MLLSTFLHQDRDALLCDLAECYHVLNMDELPVETLAALAAGLPADSRSKRKLSGHSLSVSETLLAGILDTVNLIKWMLSEDGAKGRNRPESILQLLTEKDSQPESDLMTFYGADAFEAARRRILEGGGENSD